VIQASIEASAALPRRFDVVGDRNAFDDTPGERRAAGRRRLDDILALFDLLACQATPGAK